MVPVGLELDPWLEGLEVRLEDLGAVPVACCLSAKGDGSPLMTRLSYRCVMRFTKHCWRCSQRLGVEALMTD